MEYSKLGLEHFSPEYMQYFYHLEDNVKEGLIKKQDLMYKGISFKTIGDIFDRLYQLSIHDECSPLIFLPHCTLTKVQKRNLYQLEFRQAHLQQDISVESEQVIFATGYCATPPVILQEMEDYLQRDNAGNYAINEDFSIKTYLKNKIFMQNNTLYSHGIGSPDLGLGCYRNSVILNTITNEKSYPIHPNNVFQQFNLLRSSV
jgi:lysine N6-hydroxylase